MVFTLLMSIVFLDEIVWVDGVVIGVLLNGYVHAIGLAAVAMVLCSWMAWRYSSYSSSLSVLDCLYVYIIVFVITLIVIISLFSPLLLHGL